MLVVVVLLSAIFLPVVIWAIVTRPSWQKLRSEIYSTLSCLGILFAWGVFLYRAW